MLNLVIINENLCIWRIFEIILWLYLGLHLMRGITSKQVCRVIKTDI